MGCPRCKHNGYVVMSWKHLVEYHRIVVTNPLSLFEELSKQGEPEVTRDEMNVYEEETDMEALYKRECQDSIRESKTQRLCNSFLRIQEEINAIKCFISKQQTRNNGVIRFHI